MPLEGLLGASGGPLGERYRKAAVRLPSTYGKEVHEQVTIGSRAHHSYPEDNLPAIREEPEDDRQRLARERTDNENTTRGHGTTSKEAASMPMISRRHPEEN